MNVHILVIVRKTKQGSDQDIIGVYKNENDARYVMKDLFEKEKQFFEKHEEQLTNIIIWTSRCEFTSGDVTYQYYINTKRLN